MAVRPAGNEWLKAHFGLSQYSFTHTSFIGNNAAQELTSKGNIEQVYGPRYAPGEELPLTHLEFSLKYDDIDLDFLQAVLTRIPALEIDRYINKTPGGKYARIIGFLYEFLTQQSINLQTTTKGNFIDLLDADKYVTGTVEKNSKWRINNNLLGTAAFCPIVRKTRTLEQLLIIDIAQGIEKLRAQFPVSLFTRAISYLYKKETQSSYEIEKEKPSADRMERFIAILTKAGTKPTNEVLEKSNLIRLQNIIVDPRFAAKDFRDFQNYVGEMLPNHHALIHYICPLPAMVLPLMDGLQNVAAKTADVPAGIRAALFAFGFVFIHPFEDGNGRLHRFLIHDTLAQNGLVPPGIIIPVSAHMLNNMRDYDQVLEQYSKPLMQRIQYDMNDDGAIQVLNPNEVAGYFKYPDLTAPCIYLMETIISTLQEDMPGELLFMQRYDEARRELQSIVDMPDKDLNQMLVFLHQNKGAFPKRRREQFSKLTDAEIVAMEAAYSSIFGL